MAAGCPSPRIRQLEIEQDVYDFLKNVGELGESPSSILRRLLPISRDPSGGGPHKTSVSVPISVAEALPRSGDAISVHLQSEGYRFLRIATDRYLSLLSAAYKAEPESFKRVFEISGYSRVYFAKTAAEIAKAGRSTAPQQIPNTPYFALTNADTKTKITMMRQVLHRLGYSKETVEAACTSIP
jgi:negative modulator of initiation of replication